jgi:hypothetical protein
MISCVVVVFRLVMDPYIGLRLLLIRLLVLDSQVTSRLCVLNPNDITPINVVVFVDRGVDVLVRLNSPLSKVLGHIGFIPRKKVFWISSS